MNLPAFAIFAFNKGITIPETTESVKWRFDPRGVKTF